MAGMLKPLRCIRRFCSAAMSEREGRERRRRAEKPASPLYPPSHRLGLTACAKAAASPEVVAPRYASHHREGHGGEESAPARSARSRSRRDKGHGHRGEGDGHRRRRKKATPAPEPAGKSEPVDKRAAKFSSSSGPGSGDSSEEDVAAEPASALAVPNVPPSALAMGTRPAAPVPAWLQSRVQDLTRKASVFARALTRAQQALRTSARIAREAAQSFESELENFQIASREIEKEFQGKH